MKKILSNLCVNIVGRPAEGYIGLSAIGKRNVEGYG